VERYQIGSPRPVTVAELSRLAANLTEQFEEAPNSRHLREQLTGEPPGNVVDHAMPGQGSAAATALTPASALVRIEHLNTCVTDHRLTKDSEHGAVRACQSGRITGPCFEN
jgi:hypothetical protein